MPQSAVDEYHSIATNLSEVKINQIIDFYKSFKADDTINLHFRFIKVYGIHVATNEPRWILLHKWINKRRIDNKNLAQYLQQLIHDGFIPLRVFQSVSEWFAPHEVFSKNQFHPRLLRSGFIPFENDESLLISIKVANQVVKLINNDVILIYSGNKSIHVWYPFDLPDYLHDRQLSLLYSSKQTENLDRMVRKQIYTKIKRQMESPLDHRIAEDSRRVVPIIGTFNGITGRRVMKLTLDQLQSTSLEHDLIQSRFPAWFD
ncbi:MAG: hypothetical protein OEZ01_02200 [Candidatus Heimdallarchaeota archaeon]|nr:hypothetical protein [Candidatus Heimdallarchaeota archaeon]